MYKQNRQRTTTINVNKSYEGERIEQKIERIVNNKEPISDNAPIIYTERKDGVKPEHDIRTDRFEVAVDAMDKVSKSLRARRENKPGDKLGAEAKEGMKKEGNSGAETTQTTT